jgi:hypothetical protein
MPEPVDNGGVTGEAAAPVQDASTSAPENTPVSPDNPEQRNKKIADNLHNRAESSRANRRGYYSEWKRNVELRLGRIASQFTGGVRVEDEVQTEINPDWSLTKTKTANLYSQVPTVQGTHENLKYAPAVAPFMKQLNYELGEKRMNIAVAMEEVLNDVVNAAGVGAVLVEYAARFEEVDVPNIDTSKLDPQVAAQMQAAGQIQMVKAQRVVSDKFMGTRVSPINLLWPAEFVGSNFDDGDWIGHTGRCTWSVAKNEFNLTDEQKTKVLAGFDLPVQDTLRSNPEKGGLLDVEGVKYTELFYWRHRFDPDEKYFKAIWRIVFVQGFTDPVIHEPWKGQKLDEQARTYVGSCKFPLRVLTLTYITDNPIPPSDSSAGRPQVNDMRRSRSQMFKNRERSIPIRWFDVNRIDPALQDTLMRGTWQGMIPVQGDGTRTIGEIARASYPSEDLTFDERTKSDLMETWQIGPNQLGTQDQGRKTAGEASITQQNFATRIGQERGRVAAFFLSICEVLAGLMCLNSNFPILTDEEKQRMMQAWDQKKILHDLVLKIRPDSTIVLDVNARIERIAKFLNLTAKSGYVNVEPLIAEMAELSGLDPAAVMIKPEPKKPEEPNISYRFTGKDDMLNPMVIAILQKAGFAPSVEEIQQAKQLLDAATAAAGPGAPPQSGAPGAPPPAPGGPPGQGGQPHPLDTEHPEWSLASKIAARSRDMGES